MNITMMLSITSLFYIIILNILFFSKSNLKNKETKIYSIVIVSVLFGIILELLMRVTANIIIDYPLINDSVSKLFLMYTIFWFSLITLYNYLKESTEKKYKNFRKII